MRFHEKRGAMLLQRLLAILCQLACVFSQINLPNDPDPEFLAPLENHTVTLGRDIYFTCVVNHLGSYKVAWIKSDSKAILAIHTHMVAHNPRLSVTHNGHNTWMLHVSNVQKNDSGTYMCQINTDPMRSQMGYLEVVIPPDILDEDSDGGAAAEGGSVRLRCKATGVPEPSVLWRREDGRPIVLRHRDKQVVRFSDGETLVLSGVQRADMGSYLCIASNGVPPSISKRFSVKVHFHPLVKVSNQLVAAPIFSDVVIQCYVEASPKAMNSWRRETGEKLIQSDKYALEETYLNDYSLLMNLTIRSLERRDFGTYICSSSNALGKAEGTVRLQELHLTMKTTPATLPTTTTPATTPPTTTPTTTTTQSSVHRNVEHGKQRKKPTAKEKMSDGKRKRPKSDEYEDDAALDSATTVSRHDVVTVYGHFKPTGRTPWVDLKSATGPKHSSSLPLVPMIAVIMMLR